MEKKETIARFRRCNLSSFFRHRICFDIAIFSGDVCIDRYIVLSYDSIVCCFNFNIVVVVQKRLLLLLLGVVVFPTASACRPS